MEDEMVKEQIVSGHPALNAGPIYLDYNATTPVDPLVVGEMTPYLSVYFGNPSSGHNYAQVTRAAVRRAREQVAEMLTCEPDELVFTGSGSEADTLAIRGVALAQSREKDHIITQVTEHPAVLKACDALQRLYGWRVTYLPVDSEGRVDPMQVEAAIDDRTALVTIMLANNETGTLQPIADITRIAHRYGALMHTDAAQAIGKVSVNVRELDIDLLTVVGHKFYAPKGIGALYVRRGVQLEPTIYGGGQEMGRRAGTENTAFIVALGTAAQLVVQQMNEDQTRVRQLRDMLQQMLEQALPGRIHLNGHVRQRLPNTLNVSIDGIVGEDLLAALPEIASSTGSACHEGSTDPSPVLLAMGKTRARALAALRLTLGRWSTAQEIEHAAHLLVERMKADLPRHM
jgi:cysteine desulfurase